MTKTKGTKEWAVKNVNFSVGCENDCKYCYAKAMAYRFGRIKNREEWANMQNKPEMAKKRFKKVQGWIMSPSSHDITEKNVDLAIVVFRNILKARNRLLIVTKPRFECIKKICVSLDPYRSQILFRFTIGSNNTLTLRHWETNASGFEERLASLRFAHDFGYRTSVSIEPFLDENVADLVKELLPFVTDTLWIGPMNKIHVPKNLWTEKEEQLYSRESLLQIKEEVDALHSSKIRYKDHFLSGIKGSGFYRTDGEANSVKQLKIEQFLGGVNSA